MYEYDDKKYWIDFLKVYLFQVMVCLITVVVLFGVFVRLYQMECSRRQGFV